MKSLVCVLYFLRNPPASLGGGRPWREAEDGAQALDHVEHATVDLSVQGLGSRDFRISWDHSNRGLGYLGI